MVYGKKICVEYRELKNKVLYPVEVKELLEKNVTFSTSGSEGRNQGGDFVLEGMVKKQKAIAPKGVIEAKTRQRISRSLEKIDAVSENVKTLLQLKEPDYLRNVLLSDEITVADLNNLSCV